MKLARWLLAAILLSGCDKVLPVYQVPDIVVGEPAFSPTIEAYTDAPIIGSNRVEILFNGDQTFPAMLRDIETARSTITFTQYLLRSRFGIPRFCAGFCRPLPGGCPSSYSDR
jgi:hypothetical protein